MQEVLSDSYACLYCPAFKQVRFGTHCLYCVPLTRHVTMWHLVSDARLGFFCFFSWVCAVWDLFICHLFSVCHLVDCHLVADSFRVIQEEI